MDVVFSNIVHYLSGDFPFRNELTNFCMAFQGHLIVRNGRNKDGSMNWFHAFMLGVVCCFGGSSFAPLWLGKPSSILANDLGLFSLIISFIMINCMPFDIGNKLGKTFPAKLFCTTFVSLFKTMGVVGYTAAGYQAFKASPSEYYPIPIFGPIVWATLLGNMSAFFVKGFDEHLKNGMPWAFQNGLLCASFYHFFMHDTDGPIGIALRSALREIPNVQMGLDDRTFCVVCISVFMQTMGVLQMSEFLGPSFSPFSIIQNAVKGVMAAAPSSAPPSKVVTTNGTASKATNGTIVEAPEGPIKDFTKKKSKSKSKKNKKTQ